MAHINLLPWREELRAERQKQFVSSMIFALVVAAILLYGVIFIVDGWIEQQNSRNGYLQQEIAKLDKEIKEIEKLEEEREKLLARIQVIQELQSSRPKVVKVLDSIVRLVPDGVHLEKLDREGPKFTLSGIAESNARISVFMNQIDKNIELKEANLQVIQKTSEQEQSNFKTFTLNVDESKPKIEGEGE
jgi:type IV pilus assembly protein PilN